MSRNLILVYAMVVIDAIAGTLVFPILTNFTKDLKGGEFWLPFCQAIFYLVQLFSAPYLGSLADKMGRSPVFKLASLGTFFSYIIALPLNLQAFISNRLVDGTTNGFYTAVRSSVTDMSNKKTLHQNLGILNTLVASAFILGPAISGVILALLPEGGDEARTIIYASIFLCVVNVIIAFNIKETKPSNGEKHLVLEPELEDIEKLDFAEINLDIPANFKFKEMIPTFVKIWNTNRKLGLIIFIELLKVMLQGYYFYFLIFAEGKLNMTPREISSFLVYFGIMIVLVQTIFFTQISKRIDTKKMLVFSAFSGTLVLLMYTMVTTITGLYIIAFIDVLTISLLGGVSQGMVGEYSPKNLRATVIGLIVGFSSILTAVNFILFGALGHLNVNLPFLWFAACAFVIGVLALKIQPDKVDLKRRKTD
jgi:MFS transporter, DHA1 family, tetracycline resistance protein